MKRRKITAGKLSKILKEHKRWIDDKEEGEQADLYKADLSGAKLIYANLSDADLRDANLSGANLYKADLYKADLYKADLSEVLGLNIEQLSMVQTLYEAELDSELKKQVKDKYPHLLEEPEY
jgi:uncharacterized protein YjbI with pentapeptide repeats